MVKLKKSSRKSSLGSFDALRTDEKFQLFV
jgi:hypothetical protein